MCETWGKKYQPSEAVAIARGGMAANDRRLAHDVLWDASMNGHLGTAGNGWSIPDRSAFNAVVNDWPFDKGQELSYEGIASALVKKSKMPCARAQNRVTRVTASIHTIADIQASNGGTLLTYHFKCGSNTTETTFEKLNASISCGFGPFEASVSV